MAQVHVYPDYVKTDYDRWIFDNVVNPKLVEEWREFLELRRCLKSRQMFPKASKCWRKLDFYWHTLKRLYIEAGGEYVKPWYV